MKNYDFKEEARFLHTLDPTEYALVATIIGILISQNLSINEKNSLGNFIIEIGQVMLTIAAQENLMVNLNHTSVHNDVEDKIRNLEKEINELKKSRFNNQ